MQFRCRHPILMTFRKPTGYKPPSSGGKYFRPSDGESRIRIVSSSFIQGNEAWEDSTDGKKRPVRCPLGEIIPGAVRDQKEFWAFGVLDYCDLAVKVWVITQRGIQQDLDGLMDDPDWGALNAFDLKIRRQGKGLNTDYSVTPSPKAPLSAESRRIVEESPVNLEALFSNEDPFAVDVNPDGSVTPDSGAPDADGTTGYGDAEDEDDVPF